MSGLAISEAPPPGIPLRFLVAAVLWGAFAGVWIAGQGNQLASRWTPATIALVHILVLGVIGNAMLGALTQFLPGCDHQEEGLGSPLLDARLYPKRACRIHDQSHEWHPRMWRADPAQGRSEGRG